MIIMTHRLIAQPKKRRELIQTILDLIIPFRKMNGCLRHTCYQSLENENSFILISEWNTKEDLDNYIRSEGFDVLQGVKVLLADPQKIQFDVVSYSSGMEFLESLAQ